MSFFWWWKSKSNDNRDEEEEDEAFCLEYTKLSDKERENLPELPFTYKSYKPWLFISRSSAYAYAAIITDLDFQLLHHLAAQEPTLYYNDVSLSDILDDALFSDDSDDIQAFFDLFKVDACTYAGVGEVPFMDFINSMETDANADVTELDQVCTDVQEHHAALYDECVRLV